MYPASVSAAAVEAIAEFWGAGGLLMLPLAGLCYLVWLRYLRERARFRAALCTPDSFLAELERRWWAGIPAEELDRWLRIVPGAVAGHARSILRLAVQGGDMDTAISHSRLVLAPLERRSFEGLAALVAAAPLLGLLGTILGMIETFQGVSLPSGQTAELVASGISKALITTQVGLVAALPGAFGLAHLHRLRQTLSNRLDLAETQVRIQSGGSAPKGSGAL